MKSRCMFALMAAGFMTFVQGAPNPAEGPFERATCNHDNCYRQVAASAAKPGSASARADCSSILAVTIIPCPFTATIVAAASTITFTATNLLPLTFTATTVTPPGVTNTVNQPITQTITVTQGAVAKRRRRIPFNDGPAQEDIKYLKRVIDPACTSVQTVRKSAIPTYASSCRSPAQYTSACLCNSVTTRVITLVAQTTTVTVPANAISTTVTVTSVQSIPVTAIVPIQTTDVTVFTTITTIATVTTTSTATFTSINQANCPTAIVTAQPAFTTVPDSCGFSILDTANMWRSAYGLSPFVWSAALTNVAYGAAHNASGGAKPFVHSNLAYWNSSAEVETLGYEVVPAGANLQGDTPFGAAIVNWLCEMPSDPQLQKTGFSGIDQCNDIVRNTNYISEGAQTFHHDIFLGSFSAIGCAFVYSNPPNQYEQFAGLWVCDFHV